MKTAVLIGSLLIGCTTARLQATEQRVPLNVLLICIDDLRPELNCYGATHIRSPHIDRLAENGILFRRHYVNAPSCGPSRFTLLTGQYGGSENNALFERAELALTAPDQVAPTLPEWFKMQGYTTVSVGKVSHHPGGRGGADWDSDQLPELPGAWDRHLMPAGLWKHPRGAMHGLANGEIRTDPGNMDVFQSAKGGPQIYPDGLIAQEGLKQLETLSASKKPFFLAIGLIKPHLPFGAPASFMDMYKEVSFPPVEHPKKPEAPSTWHESGEFMRYNRWGKDPRTDESFALEVRRHYAACVSYADHHVGAILDQLKKSGAHTNTVVVLWGDHGWHLGEHDIWGKHSLFEESLRAPLIISAPDMPHRGNKTDAVVETLDLFPTLCDLTGIEKPSFPAGVSLKPWLNNPSLKGHDAIAYFRDAVTIRTERWRLIRHTNGAVELYDHDSDEGETLNVAKRYPEIVTSLTERLESKTSLKQEITGRTE